MKAAMIWSPLGIWGLYQEECQRSRESEWVNIEEQMHWEWWFLHEGVQCNPWLCGVSRTAQSFFQVQARCTRLVLFSLGCLRLGWSQAVFWTVLSDCLEVLQQRHRCWDGIVAPEASVYCLSQVSKKVGMGFLVRVEPCYVEEPVLFFCLNVKTFARLGVRLGWVRLVFGLVLEDPEVTVSWEIYAQHYHNRNQWDSQEHGVF